MAVIPWLKIIRPKNLAIVLVTQVITSIFILKLGPNLPDIIGVTLVIIGTLVITSAGYLINDYYDIKIDYVNRPDEVIAGRYIKRRWILFYAIVLNVLGVALGLFASLIVAFVNMASAFLLWFYSNQLKRLPFIGNFSVAFLTALSLLILGIYFNEFPDALIIYALFAFFMTLIREIIKDMEDRRGDRKFGCKTLPIVIGIRKTKRIIYLILGIFFTLLASLSLISGSTIIISLFLVMSALLIDFSIKIYRSDTVLKYHKLSQYCKNIMVFGVLSMIFV